MSSITGGVCTCVRAHSVTLTKNGMDERSICTELCRHYVFKEYVSISLDRH